MTRRRLVLGAVLVIGALILAACAAGSNDAATTGGTQLAGFWQGVWHGIISPVAFVVSLFTRDVGMYEVHNSGHWYDYGFLLGVMLVFSGGGAGSRRGASRSSSARR